MATWETSWETVGRVAAALTPSAFHSAMQVWLHRPHLANQRVRHGTQLLHGVCVRAQVLCVLEALRVDPRVLPVQACCVATDYVSEVVSQSFWGFVLPFRACVWFSVS